MIQVNLLPDVKLNYIKAKKTKRTAVSVAIGITGAAIAIVVLLFLVVNVLQKEHLKNLNNDIAKYSQELEATADLDKILTIQNQLNSITPLHDEKVVSSRFFQYLSRVTPTKASISKADIDFETNTLALTGTADSITTINKFADTLKFTSFKIAEGESTKAFSSVVLSNFSQNSDGSATYQLDMSFDPLIFDSANEVQLSVPNIISTRSETEKPDDLFKPEGAGQN